MEQAPSPTNPTLQRPYASFYEALHKIRSLLPDPVENTPDGYARRDQAVVEQIAQLVPASGVEAELAAHFVAASEYGLHCLREARNNQDEEELHAQLVAQAACMGRDARGYLSSLHRVQLMRMKREQTEAGAYQADAIEDNARVMLQAALADPPNAEEAVASDVAMGRSDASAAPAKQPVPARHPAPAAPPRMPAPAPRLSVPPRLIPTSTPRAARPRTDDDWPELDWPLEAERYAIIYPDRARLIRSLGGLPHPCTFGPPEPQLVEALLAGSTPTLRALDAPATPAAPPRCA